MNKIKFFIVALAGLFVAACVGNNAFEEITSVPLKKCLEPTNLSANVDENTGVTTTFKWNVTGEAENYILKVTTVEGVEVLYDTLAPAQIPYVVDLEADGKYSFTVQGIASGREDSEIAQYDGTIKTYAIKDNLFLTLVGKTSDSVTLSWSKDADDYKDVSHLEATPVSNSELKAVTLDLEDNEAARTAATATITGLQPSTQYCIVLFFKSAGRGNVTVWTSPAQGTLTKVTTVEALKEIMTNGGEAYLGTEGSPYVVSSVIPTAGFKIYGETDAEGKRPVIQTLVSMKEALADQEFYFENVDLTGGNGSHSYIMQKADGGDETITAKFVNCGIYGYSSGLVNQNKNGKMTFTELSFEGCDMYDISGGEGINIRKNADIKKIVFKNNTIWDAFTCFIRIDSTVPVGEFVFENNLLKKNSITGKGVFYVRSSAWTSLSLKKNILLWEDGAATEFFAGDTVLPGTLDAADNYAYQVGEKFFEKLSAANGKFTVLSEDPCYNSKGNVFNLSVSAMQQDQIGPSKWWNAFVEPVEDLTLEAIETPHTWDLADATLFAGDNTKSKVRDGLLLVASSECPMNLDGGITFNAAAGAVGKKGVPSDGYLAFKVTTAGSVVFKSEDTSSSSSQILVALGDADGAGASVKGGAFAGTNKVVLSGITGESMVYLYPTGPCKISALAWSADQSVPNTALATPELTISTDQVNQGDATEVTVSWNAVESAADYSVRFNKKTETVTETSFVIEASAVAALAAGSYPITVVANPASSDIYNTPSSEAVAVLSVLGGGGVPVEKTMEWDFSSKEWQDTFVAFDTGNVGAGKDITADWDLTVGEFNFYCKGDKNRYGATYLQTGGSGSKTKRVFTFTAPAAGTLTVVSSNTGGDPANPARNVAVCVGDGAAVEKSGGAGSATPDTNTFDITEAGTVYIYGTGALRYYKISFVYTEISGGTPAQQKYDYVCDFSSKEWQDTFVAFDTGNVGAGKDITADWDLTVGEFNFYCKGDKNRYGATYLQTGGSGSKTKRVFTFTAPAAGTLTVVSSNTGGDPANPARNVAVCVGDGAAVEKSGGAGSATPDTNTFDITEAGTVYIYGTGALRFYKIEFHSN